MATPSFPFLFRQFKTCLYLVDPENDQKKLDVLKSLSRTALPANKLLADYVDALLFLFTHAASASVCSNVEKEFQRIGRFLLKRKSSLQKQLLNSGLPYISTHYRFTIDKLNWLQQQKQVQLTMDPLTESEIPLNDLLRMTLPSVEKELTTMALSDAELLEYLQIKPKETLTFLLTELDKLSGNPPVKDHLAELLNIHTSVIPSSANHSRIYNRLPFGTHYFHTELLRKFDIGKLINTALPAARVLSAEERTKVIDVIKWSLALTTRETDPVTYLDPSALLVYELERGITVTLYGMTADRQLPFESYVGFTLFKNGLPASYGGAWVFGKRSMFGINIFEPYRGGESAFVMAQLLRVYKQVFQLNFFEVEPYQYGADNPEGIRSGAFWFYYRFGFRPLDKSLLKLSDTEARKIKEKPGYRSSNKILEQFTESNIGWQMEAEIPPRVADFTAKISKMIRTRFKGNRKLAVEESVKELKKRIKLPEEKSYGTTKCIEEYALLAAAENCYQAHQLKMISELVQSKASDQIQYQRILQQFLASC